MQDSGTMKSFLLKTSVAALLGMAGVAYSYKNDFEQSAQHYSKAIELSPKMADAHSGLAFVLYRLGKYGLAMQHLTQAEELGAKVNPDLREALQHQIK